jgi:hypothetical protein
MLFNERLFIPEQGISHSIEISHCVDNPGGLTDTHQKSLNWDDVQDGIWNLLMVNDN